MSQGILHRYGYNLTAFEFTTHPTKKIDNVLICIGGLGDGLLDVPWVPRLLQQIELVNSDKKPEERWVVVQALVRSSYQGWSTSSLDNDIEDLAKLVEYLRNQNRTKIVLAGHSTGSQDVLKYISSRLHDSNAKHLVDGGILQAGVSDVQSMNSGLKAGELEELCLHVKTEYLDLGKDQEILPLKFRKIAFGTPITASRFYSIAKEKGTEDFFSSYLTAEDHKSTWGKVDKPILVLPGLKDEFVPKTTDQSILLEDWKQATNPQYWSNLSHVIKGANHKIDRRSDEGAMEDIVTTIVKFLESI